MKKNIVVLGYESNAQTLHQVKTLQQLDANVVFINPYGNAGIYSAFSWEEGNIIWDGQVLSPDRIDGILIQVITPEVPGEDAFNTASDQKLNWEQWFRHFCIQRDRSDALLSLLLHYGNLGIPIFNPVSHYHLSRYKPYQIQRLKEAGCLLPPTLISNNPIAATEFIQAHGQCIMKPVAGGALTLSANDLITSGQIQSLSQVPAIIQKRILGKDLRVTLVEDEIVSCVVINVPESSLDFRGGLDYIHGKVHYDNYLLPDAVQEQCRRGAQAVGLRYTGIDIRVTPKGEYFMLECNSAPVYLGIEQKMGHPITEKLCKALLKAKP
ncbi:ATP-grasp domain-containing protein [Thiolinea disciformis]|uniref:ATP-grasp domain-containing protein n=1 Tax=Thiolinea disciformis TaxID=125614 RepID=UPI000380307A|nr:hypothetical protein [Thiolinea disciformis]